MTKSVLIIGMNHFGVMLATKLQALGHDVMAVDRDEERINQVSLYVTDAQIGDSTNEEFLKTLGVGEYDLCIVSITADFQSSLVTTSLLKELGAKRVLSRADMQIQERFLLRNGADEVINPSRQAAEWTVARYAKEWG